MNNWDLIIGNRILDAIKHDNGDELAKMCASDKDISSHRFVYLRHTPLHIAARDGKFKAATALLDAGADINALNDTILTPLCMAAQKNNVDMIKFLLERGARADHTTDSGHSELPYSVVDAKTAKLLHEKGMPLNGSPYCEPLTHSHYLQNRLDMARFLIDRGVSVDTQAPSQKDTLLHIAVQKNDVGFAAELLEKYHANPNLVDKDGYTPADMAGIHGREEMFGLLASKGGKWDIGPAIHTPLIIYSASRGRANMVSRLLDSGDSIEARGSDGATPLIAACRCGNGVDVVRLLIDRGADIGACDKAGKTARIYAEERNRDDIVAVFQEVEEARKAEAARKTHECNLASLDRILKNRRPSAPGEKP